MTAFFCRGCLIRSLSHPVKSLSLPQLFIIMFKCNSKLQASIINEAWSWYLAKHLLTLFHLYNFAIIHYTIKATQKSLFLRFQISPYRQKVSVSQQFPLLETVNLNQCMTSIVKYLHQL